MSHYPYHQSLVYKVMMATINGKVHLNPDHVLQTVKDVNRITRGLKQILYLTGWQYDGHDTGYPSWSQANPHLRCGNDATARNSLLRLIQQASEYNAAVSVHVNMSDAYEHSPLWETYRKEDLLIRTRDGSLLKGGIWDGGQSYLVSKKREWESGIAKKRIDELFDYLPLQSIRTVHLDAFEPRTDPFHGITAEEDADAMAEVLRYWISKSADVTTEWFHPRFAGLTPMVWHLNTEESERLKYPASLLCGGGSSWNFRRKLWTMDTYGANWIRQPGAGCLYERPWGEGFSYEFTRPGIDNDFIDGLCLKTLPGFTLNQLARVRHLHTADCYEVQYSDDVVARVRDDGRSFLLARGDEVMVDGHDVAMQPGWRTNEIWAYSREGMRKEWSLPEKWHGIGSFSVEDLRNAGGPRRHMHADRGRIMLELSPGQALVLTPE